MSGQEEPGRTDAYEETVDQAIAACEGDLRAIIKALLIANGYLEVELETVFQSVSRGYARGRTRPERRDD